MAGFARMVAAVVVGVALLTTSAGQKAPRFKACKKNQPPPKLNECVKDSLQKAIPELVKGIPEYGVVTIDPLRITSLDVAKSNNKKRAVSVDISFKNLDIFGLRNVKIKSSTVDVNKYKLTAKLEVPGTVNLIGDYTVKGKVLVLPIEGTGRCNLTVVNLKGEITEMLGKPFTKAGKQYAHVTSLKFVVNHVDRVYFDLQNLFNGNKELGDNMNLVLNDNWNEVFQDMIGPVASALGQAVGQIADRALSKVPYNEVFP